MSKIKGRPVGGGLKIHRALLADLPPDGSAGAFAQALEISFSTIRMWIVMQGAPATRMKDKARWLLNRKAFVEWLETSGKVL